MRSLSDTVARLASLRKAREAQRPGGGSSLSEMTGFGSNPGQLRAWTHGPVERPASVPLVVVLHGCTQTAAGYDHGAGWSELADRHGFALLFPEQQRSNNSNLCFNWFERGDIVRGKGEALSIHQMIAAACDTLGADPARVYITGLSAGGAMTAVMLATYPETFAAGAIIAGLPYGAAISVPEAFDRMRGHGLPSRSELGTLLSRASEIKGPPPRLSIWHGDSDRTVDIVNADAVLDQWRDAAGIGDTPSRTETVNGHRRRVWTGPDGGDVIESYTIAGLGHGTPLDTRGENAVGAAAPHMLEAGISSTVEIARFFGLVPPGAETAATAVDTPSTLPAKVAPIKPRREPLAPAYSPKAGVAKVIEDALRSAGLMK